MEIQGLGSSYFPLIQEKSTPDKSGPGFGKMLQKLVNKNNTNQPAILTKDKNDTDAADQALSFLKDASIQDFANGKPETDSNSPTDCLQTVQNLLGISDKKWSEILSETETSAKGKLKDVDPMSMFIEGLSFLTMNPAIAGLTDNIAEFVKAAKVYNLLSDQDGLGQPLLASLLDSLKDQLQSAVPLGQAESKSSFLQNTFSQVVNDLNEQKVQAAQANRLKTFDRLTDFNANSPFLQQMSKPEQLLVMAGTTQKAVSVNDLIKQFETILSKSQFSKMGGVQKLFIKLNPEHLGSISIELIRKNETLTAKILTTTEAAKEALVSHLHNLKHAFEAQNIKVDNVDIGQQSSSDQHDDFFNHGQSNQQETQQDSRQEDDYEDTGSSFILTLEDAILNQEA